MTDSGLLSASSPAVGSVTVTSPVDAEYTHCVRPSNHVAYPGDSILNRRPDMMIRACVECPSEFMAHVALYRFGIPQFVGCLTQQPVGLWIGGIDCGDAQQSGYQG